MSHDIFFLGGRDLEMVEIANLVVNTRGCEAVRDLGLAWGARASAYGDEPARLAAKGHRPVLVELTLDTPPPKGAVIVDHHGDRAGEPSSLAQVFALLGLPADRWTRHLALVDANDRGHVAAMRAFGATDAEMAAIRAADRAAQGITPDQMAEGLAALREAEARGDGRLLAVALPHNRTATITDPLALAGIEPEVLLIGMPGEIAVFGPGPLLQGLDRAHPGGWLGGDLPGRGFWGKPVAGPDNPKALIQYWLKVVLATLSTYPSTNMLSG